MKTNATIVSITRANGGATEPRAIRCLFTGSTLAEQGATAAKLAGSVLIPHHEIVRDLPEPPHGHPKVGDSLLIRLDAADGEFGDDTAYVVETARGHPGGALKHWQYSVR